MSNEHENSDRLVPAVKKYKVGQQPKEREYWLTRSPIERLAAQEEIRREHHKSDDEPERRLQRVFQIVKRK